MFLYRAAFFGLFDTAKIFIADDPKRMNFFAAWALAQGVTIVSGMIAYPWDTLRRRMIMQSGRKQVLYKSALDCAAKILRNEGPAAFYRGILSNVLREPPIHRTAGFKMSLPPLVAKEPKLSSEKQISDLADAELSEVFKRLPPHDRLIASEICRRWNELSRKAWVDVKHLNLGSIPGKHLAPIIRMCPNLRSVFACGKFFDLNELACLSKASQLSAVKLYDCTFAFTRDYYHRVYAFAKIFGDNVQQASWNELIIHNALVEDKTVAASSRYAPMFNFSGEFLPASLTRLQVSGLRTSSTNCCGDSLNALDRFQNLECLILHTTPDRSCTAFELIETAFCRPYLFAKISALKNLKELCIGPVRPFFRQAKIGRLIANLPKLEVLFLNELDYDMVAQDLADLITKNSVLRILVLSGDPQVIWHSPINLPARKRFPNGFGSDPLPLLHIFVSKAASELLRFSKSTSDAALIHPINEPMPRFLEREDIAPIFGGVWVAEKIKEAARNGGRLWDYDIGDTACSVQNVEI